MSISRKEQSSISRYIRKIASTHRSIDPVLIAFKYNLFFISYGSKDLYFNFFAAIQC